jgi:hypothetical protein
MYNNKCKEKVYMSNIDIKSMFESIKSSLNTEKQGNATYKDIMKLEVGNTYVVRMIPNVQDPKSTIFHYFHHGFTSNETGQYVDAICPTTWGERCLICEERFKLWKKGDEDSKNIARLIRRLEKHLVNVYIVNDPVKEENNGTTKVLRMGVRMYEKVQSAIEGDDADEFGSRVFDLSDAGCNFKIKVETSQDGAGASARKFTNYNNSRFTAPSAITGMTPNKLQEVYETIHDLTKFVERKSDDELSTMLKTHALGSKKIEKADRDDVSSTVKAAAEVVTESAPSKPAKAKSGKSEAAQTANDSKIKELLAGLDND